MVKSREPLFDDVHRDDTSVAGFQESTFAFLNRIAGNYWDHPRWLMQQWMDRINDEIRPARFGKPTATSERRPIGRTAMCRGCCSSTNSCRITSSAPRSRCGGTRTPFMRYPMNWDSPRMSSPLMMASFRKLLQMCPQESSSASQSLGRQVRLGRTVADLTLLTASAPPRPVICDTS